MSSPYNEALPITGLVAGDDWTIRRTVVAIPTGQSLVMAWFTVKNNVNDEDTAAVLQKEIDLADDPGVGQIEDSGAGDGTAVLRFDLTKDNTLLFKPYVKYEYDVQVKTSAGKYNTPDRGLLIANSQVTRTV